MAQHDFIVDDGPPASVRQDINAAFLALATNNSGASAPIVTYPCMFWADTSAAQLLRQRSVDNTSWITVGQLNQPNLGRAPTGLGLTTTGMVYYNATAGTFGTAAGGVVQALAPFVVNTPTTYTPTVRFNDGVTAAISNAQGSQIFTRTITPIFQASTMRIDVQLTIGTPSTVANFSGCLALFSNLSAGPVGYSWVFFERLNTLRASFFHAHNTTSAITYEVRFGPDQAHAGTNLQFFLNRGNANPTLASTSESWIAVEEML